MCVCVCVCVEGRINAPEDVHALILESLNMLHYMAKRAV